MILNFFDGLCWKIDERSIAVVIDLETQTIEKLASTEWYDVGKIVGNTLVKLYSHDYKTVMIMIDADNYINTAMHQEDVWASYRQLVITKPMHIQLINHLNYLTEKWSKKCCSETK